jgi:hypothetical protein
LDPYTAETLITEWRKRAAKVAPDQLDHDVAGKCQGKSRRRAKAMETRG